MLTKDREKLMVFENFFLDKTLPKFKKADNDRLAVRQRTGGSFLQEPQDDFFDVTIPSTPTSSRVNLDGFADNGFSTNFGGVIRHKPEDEAMWNGLNINTKNSYIRMYLSQNYNLFFGIDNSKPRGLIKKLVWKFVKNYYKKRFIQQSTGSVEDFFINVKNSVEELNHIETRIENYKQAFILAKKSGQAALAEKIKGQISVVSAETQLFAIKLIKFIEEKNIISFVVKSERGLRLDWIKNFTRNIPQEVLDTKFKCDELGIFDNYCILHYDPDNKANDLTKEEKKKRKDPILFGMIENSRKLYFVGDWVDELCDLTLSEMIKVMGENKVGEITDQIEFAK